MMMSPYHAFEKTLETLKNKDQFRQLQQLAARNGKYIRRSQRDCINLSSNDYLGLATNIALTAKFYGSMMDDDRLINEFGLGASSSRLLTGNSPLYEALEEALSLLYRNQSALVFNSGYHANIGIIPALAGTGDLILSDTLNHASIVDGIRLSNADRLIFNHNDMDHLKDLISDNRSLYKNVLIVTESLFSMDGDRADIHALVDIKQAFNAMLYVDEAHSVGVFGPQGQGLCYEMGCHDKVDILLGTMGKALASHGAYAIVPPVIKSLLLNRMRSLLYSTALPPVAVTWNLFVLNHMKSLAKERKQLFSVSNNFRSSLIENGIETIGDSHIIPVMTRSNKAAVQLSGYLIEKGFLVFPIRPPTVPESNSRLRFSLTSDIEYRDLAPIAGMIKDFMDDQRK